MSRSRSNLVLLLGAVFSLLAHLALGWLLMTSPTPKLAVADPFMPDAEDELELGVADSDAVTITWMGFDKPTDHQARLSEVEQAAMTTDPAGGGAAAAAGEVAPENRVSPPQTPVQPTPEPVAALPDEQPIDLAVDDEAEVSQRSPERIDDQADTPEEERPDETTPTEQEAEPSPEQEAVELELTTPQPTEDVSDDTETTEEEAPEADDAGTVESEGEAADRESPATSLKAPLEIKPGKPAAQEGLEVKSRIPRFTSLQRTRIRSRKPRPILEFYFRRDGNLAKVLFAVDEESGEVYDTGMPDVDEALLNELFDTWTAEGAQLDDLPEDDEDATLKVVIRILL